MEFYNEKLLPRGLPELMCQFMPDEFYPDTKVIVHRRKQGSMLASVGPSRLAPKGNIINLYPTMMASNGGHSHRYSGTRSYKLWMAFLSTAMHEIGHLATEAQSEHVVCHGPTGGFAVYESYAHHRFVEGLANAWAYRAIERIAAVDDRVGMPAGMLTGYPGALIHRRFHNRGLPWGTALDHDRIKEWRALRCDAQVTTGDMVDEFWGRHQLYCVTELGSMGDPYDEDDLSDGDMGKLRKVCRARIHKEIHAIARHLGITRQFTNKAGTRHYLMFNAGEADRVRMELGTRRWPVLSWIDARVKRQQRKDREQAGDRTLRAVATHLRQITSMRSDDPYLVEFRAWQIIEAVRRHAADMTELDNWPKRPSPLRLHQDWQTWWRQEGEA